MSGGCYRGRAEDKRSHGGRHLEKEATSLRGLGRSGRTPKGKRERKRYAIIRIPWGSSVASETVPFDSGVAATNRKDAAAYAALQPRRCSASPNAGSDVALVCFSQVLLDAAPALAPPWPLLAIELGAALLIAAPPATKSTRRPRRSHTRTPRQGHHRPRHALPRRPVGPNPDSPAPSNCRQTPRPDIEGGTLFFDDDPPRNGRHLPSLRGDPALSSTLGRGRTGRSYRSRT
jgi:hypothetical protein